MWNLGKNETDKEVGDFQARLRDEQLRKVCDPAYREPEPEPERSYKKPIEQFLEGKWGSCLTPLTGSHVFGMENAERGAATWINALINNTGQWPEGSQQRLLFQALTMLKDNSTKNLTQRHVDALRNGEKIFADIPDAMKAAGITPGTLPEVLRQSNSHMKQFKLEQAAGKAYVEDVWPSICQNLRAMSAPHVGTCYII